MISEREFEQQIDPNVRQSRFDIVDGNFQEATPYYVQKKPWLKTVFESVLSPEGTPIPELKDLTREGFTEALDTVHKKGGISSNVSNLYRAFRATPDGIGYIRVLRESRVKKENVLSFRGKLFKLFQPFAGRALFY